MAEIHIVGTAHVSQKSVNEVLETVDLVNPDVIAIELDQGRFATLKKQMKEEEDAKAGIVSDEADGKAPEVKSILSGNFMVMIVQWLLSYVQRKIGLNVGVEPGAEMKEAIRLAEERGIRLMLIDRDINITLARFWGGMKFFEKVKLIWVLLRSVTGKDDGTDELDAVTVDSLTNQDMIDAALAEFHEFSTSGAHALIDERDAYLAHGVVSLERSSFERAVVVCGAGHVPGITRFREHPETLPPMRELTALPKKYPWGKILGVVFLVMFAVIALSIGFSGATELLVWAIVFWVVLHGILAGIATLLVKGHPLSAAVSAVLAWMTSLNPFLACGWFAALVEAKMRPPTAKDFKRIGNAESISEMLSVPLFHILLVAAASNIGASIATVSFFLFFGPVFGVDLEMMTNLLVTGFTNLWHFIISPFVWLF
ncbi:MAG TPA: TraB/GumN family protein [Methanocorpusculum sp.]|nr:TraB/GumN family protein [Methanocorpusculum sp.]